MSELVKQKIVEHIIMIGGKPSEVRIDFTVKKLLSAFSESEIVVALSSLMFHHEFFPTVPAVAKEIAKIKNGGMSNTDLATIDADKIMESIKSNSFDAAMVKAEIGERLYLAFGGAREIKNFGDKAEKESIVRAQLIKKLAACRNIQTAKENFELIKKVAGQVDVSQFQITE